MSHTKIAPEDELPPALQSPDLVTALREYGCPGEHPLPLKQESFLVGSSSSCDVRLSGEYLSLKHCVLERGQQRLRVRDLDSRNGLIYRGRKETSFDIVPGDTFSAATTRLLALNEVMRLARPVLAEILGRDQESTIDDILVDAVPDGPIVVVGPRGAGQSDLARAIHNISLRRDQPFVEASDAPATPEERRQLIDHSRRGTLVIPATGVLDETFLDTVLSPEYGAPRLVLLAPSLPTAARAITLDRLTSTIQIEIRPLWERPDEIPWLLEFQFAKHGSNLCWADLSSENRERLLHHNWPDNLKELRQTGAILAALLHHGKIRRAAEALQIPRSTMQYWLKRLRLTLPLMAAPASSPSLECSTV